MVTLMGHPVIALIEPPPVNVKDKDLTPSHCTANPFVLPFVVMPLIKNLSDALDMVTKIGMAEMIEDGEVDRIGQEQVIEFLGDIA